MEKIKEQELWKPIKGYRNFYEVSSFGRIKMLGGGLVRKNRILKAVRTVDLSNGFNKRKFLISDLIAEAFPELISVMETKKRVKAEIKAAAEFKAKNVTLSPVTIIERIDEIAARAVPEEIEEVIPPRKIVIGKHDNKTKGKWFNP